VAGARGVNVSDFDITVEYITRQFEDHGIRALEWMDVASTLLTLIHRRQREMAKVVDEDRRNFFSSSKESLESRKADLSKQIEEYDVFLQESAPSVEKARVEKESAAAALAEAQRVFDEKKRIFEEATREVDTVTKDRAECVSKCHSLELGMASVLADFERAKTASVEAITSVAEMDMQITGLLARFEECLPSRDAEEKN